MLSVGYVEELHVELESKVDLLMLQCLKSWAILCQEDPLVKYIEIASSEGDAPCMQSFLHYLPHDG